MTDPRKLELRLPQTRLLIDGRFVDPVERGSIPVLNPATGEKLCDVAAGTSADVDLAVKAARRAFDSGPWGRLSPLERGKLLHGFARLLWEAREELALLESKENGKTWREAVSWDAGPAAAFMSYWAEMPNKVLGEVLPVSGNFHTYVLKEPMGVVGAIVPWNFPSMITAWKLGPALAAGCTVVLKPSELTPLTALRLGELALEAGFPPGVVNVVPGYGESAGEALARHPQVDKISFTGSTRTARRLIHASADSNLKKLTLELGGKSPQIVLPDADLAQAVEGCFWGIFMGKGEVCTAGSRVLVHERIYDDFVNGLVERARAMVVGDPLDPRSEMGSQISKFQLDRILGYIKSGKDQGARLLTGGERDSEGPKAKGFFLRPTIFGDVKPEMKIAQEEIFGPVLSCLRFKDETHALELANSVAYGLSAALWTKDVAKAHAMARKIRTGVVWINCYNQFDVTAPFGGYKESGWGKDLSPHAMDEYLNVKAVWTKLPEI